MATQRTMKRVGEEEPRRGIEGAPLEPIRVVERELTRPDGTKLRVKVPVYPPFELKDRSATKPEAPQRKATPQRKLAAKKKAS